MIKTNACLWRTPFFSFWKQPKVNRLGSNLLWGLIKQLRVILKKTNQLLIDYTLQGRYLHILTIFTQKRAIFHNKRMRNVNQSSQISVVNKKTLCYVDKTLELLNWSSCQKNRKYLLCTNFTKKMPYFIMLRSLLILTQILYKLYQIYLLLQKKVWYISQYEPNINHQLLKFYPNRKLQLPIFSYKITKQKSLSSYFHSYRQKNWKLLWSYRLNKYQHLDKCLVITNFFTQSRGNLRWDRYNCAYSLKRVLRLRKVLISLMMTLYLSVQLQKANILLSHITERLIKDNILFKKKVSLNILRKWQRHLRFLRLCNLVFVRGIRLHITGKVKRSMRKHKYSFRYGKISTASILTALDHDSSYLKSRVGVISMDLWLFL